MISAFLTIAKTTFRESLRQPMMLVFTGAALLCTLLSPMLSSYSMEAGDGDNRMLVDIGLGNVWLAGMLLGPLAAAGLLVREIEEKTILTVITKPISRVTLLLGKFAGLAAAVTVCQWILAITLMLLLRHRVLQNAFDRVDWPVIIFGFGALILSLGIAVLRNYLHKKPFCSTALMYLATGATIAWILTLCISKTWQPQNPATDFSLFDGQIRESGLGLILVFQGTWIMCAVALMFSTRVGQVGTLIGCIVVLLLGLVISPVCQNMHTRLGLDRLTAAPKVYRTIWQSPIPIGKKSFYTTLETGRIILPNLQYHWPSDAIQRQSSMLYDPQNNQPSARYLLPASLYSALYLLATLSLAVVLFEKREVS